MSLPSSGSNSDDAFKLLRPGISLDDWPSHLRSHVDLFETTGSDGDLDLGNCVPSSAIQPIVSSSSRGPSHYKRGTIEVWDFIRDQGLNYHLGNAIKYICRAGYKDSKVDDLKKAIHYLQNELEHSS
jgi:hypothetical protein